MVWHSADDHAQRSLRVRSQHHGRSGNVHRYHRPPFPPGERRPRLRQFPRRPYVANDDLAEKFSVKRGRYAGSQSYVEASTVPGRLITMPKAYLTGVTLVA